jgi:hypothetical protein
MSQAERWLHAFAHAMAAHSLYSEGHQARRESGARLYAALGDLLHADLHPTFTFLDDTVIYRSLPLHGLREWTWGRRLGAVGIRRLEFTPDATPDAIGEFLLALHQRLSGEATPVPLPHWPGIEAGDVAVEAEPRGPRLTEEVAPNVVLELGDEVEAIGYLCGRVAGGQGVPLAEVAGVVRALTLAMHGEGELLLPRVPVRSSEEYLSSHALNTSVIAMAFAEWLGLGRRETRAIGRAALLHDIGMSRVTAEVFRVEALSDEARSGLARHPEEGARLLLAESPELELAATTAYEHHLRMDGAGYPVRRYHGEPHFISRLVAVCGAYDALRTDRVYRAAKSQSEALREIGAGAGPVYDSSIAGAFQQMMERWGSRELAGTFGEEHHRNP